MKNCFPNVGRGFTLVETLVAIAILMIAVSGPLVVANKGLISALYSKDQAMATFLAQEGMELVRNEKDSRIYVDSDKFLDFILDSGTGIGSCQSANSPCGVYANGSMVTKFISCQGDYLKCILYQSKNGGGTPGNFVNYGPGDVFSNLSPTIFTRSFYWEPVTGANGNSNEIQVTVIVSWNTSASHGESKLSSQMVATPL